MEEDVQSFDSVDFTLDTALLSNGKHEIEVTIENDSSTCSGECIPDSVTTFSFTASNKSLLPPKIYFNPEIWNCADCMAIGIPYTLTATFGSSALGAPKEVSLHTKVNGVWGKYSSAKFKNKKWVFPPITMNANTWIEVKAKFGTRNWYYKQLLKPARRMIVSSPSEVRVGKSGTATVKLPGVNYSRCVVIQRFYADYGAGSVKQYAGSISGGKIFVSARYSSSGTLDGTVTCRVNGEEILASFGWDITYW
jgi:SH3-like domain-containing protein